MPAICERMPSFDVRESDYRRPRGPWLFQPGGADDGAQGAPQPARGAAERLTTYEGHVLIVDDEPDIRETLHGLLEDEGYRVAEAVDGIGALALLRMSAHRLVVLLDYKMPRMNGAEMLQAIQRDPRLAGQHAFVLITANMLSFPPELRALLTELAIPVLPKPFDLHRVLDAVAAAGERLRSSS